MVTANQSIDDFVRCLTKANSQTRKLKRKHVKDFASFVEQTEGLIPGEWGFGTAQKVIKNGIIVDYWPIDRAIIAKYLSCIGTDKTPRGFNTILTDLKQFCDYLVEERILFLNPTYDFAPRRVIKRDMTDNRLTQEEAIDLLLAAYEYDQHVTRNFALTLLLLTTAARVSEAVVLTETDIIKHLIYTYGKTVSNVRYLLPGLNMTLEKLINDPLRLGAINNEATRYVFYHDNGGPLSPKQVNSLLREFANKAGIKKDVTSYTLRRTFANTLAEEGLSMRMIQIIFDHIKISSTEHYVSRLLRHNDQREMLNNSTVHLLLCDIARRQIRSLPNPNS